MRGEVISAALLLLVACGPSAECQRSCDGFGISDPERCAELCTRDCEELAETYGVSVERCEQIQAGEP